MDLPERGERPLRPRLWPAIAVVVAGGLWIAWTWIRGAGIRQDRVVATMGTVILVLIGLTLWLLFLSRLPWRVRWSGLGVAALAVAAFFGLFRVKGVTGDMVPILEPRWGRAAPAGPATIGDAQFQGPRRDATFPDVRLARDWSSRPPTPLWRRPVGEAWSGFAVADGLAITQEQHGDEERVVAYDARTGEPRWAHAHEARYETVVAGIGPRATPTVHEGRVFAQGATGILTALDLETGRRLWSRDVVQENGATLADWGKSAAPLVIGNRVVVSAGGRNNGRALVAYDTGSGEGVWAAGSDPANYSSPTLLTVGGRPQIVILNRASVAGHDPETGVLLWEAPFPSGQPNIALPVALGDDRILASAGYGVGSRLYQLSWDAGGRATARLLWESPRLKSKFANLIAHEGSVYGLDDGVLTCLDPATGERRWKEGRYGHGQLLLVGGLLLVQTEEGELALVEPSPDGRREIAVFRIFEGKTWNPPALAGDVLYMRNDREAAAYRLPTESEAP